MKKGHKVFGTIIGIISIIESVAIFGMQTGGYETSKSYGGDAYTGIQNASAQTANNISYLADIVQKGFAAILFVFGLTMIFLFATKVLEHKKNDEKSSYPIISQNPSYTQTNVQADACATVKEV